MGQQAAGSEAFFATADPVPPQKPVHISTCTQRFEHQTKGGMVGGVPRQSSKPHSALWHTACTRPHRAQCGCGNSRHRHRP
jgi:hypothetical protein